MRRFSEPKPSLYGMWRREGDAGWTLLEVIAVLTIIGVVAAIVAPNMQAAIESFLARQIAHGVSDTLYDLRALAVASGSVVELHGGSQDVRVFVAGREVTGFAPARVMQVGRHRVVVGDRTGGGTGWVVSFYPDGRVSPTQIEVVVQEQPRWVVQASDNGAIQLRGWTGR